MVDDSEHRPPRGPREDDSRKVYVGNVPYTTTESEIDETFQWVWSRLCLIRMPKHADTGRGKGYAFITFERATDDRDALLKYLEENGPLFMDGRKLNVDAPRPSNKRPPAFIG